MKRAYLYTLDARGEPVAVSNAEAYADGIEARVNAIRGGGVDPFAVGKTILGEGADQVEISTVFLAINHNYSLNGGPILWETALFRVGDAGDIVQRCGGGREQAEAMHAHWVEEITRELFPAGQGAGVNEQLKTNTEK